MKLFVVLSLALLFLSSCVALGAPIPGPYRINANTVVGHDTVGNTILYRTEADAAGMPVIVMYNLGHI